MSRVIVVTNSEYFELRVRHAAGGDIDAFPLGDTEFSAPAFLQKIGGPQDPQIVVLGPGMPVDAALSLATVLDSQYTATRVVLAVTLDPDEWLVAMHAGVRDVLAPIAEVGDIRLVLERANLAVDRAVAGLPTQAPTTRRGRIIAVVSPKGGSGKTTVATNLAVGLAHLAPQQTVLVDLDIQFGDVATALQLTPEHGLLEAVRATDRTDAMVLKTFLTPHSTGLYALCAPDLPDAGDSVTGEDVANLLEVLVQAFRFVVVDTSPGLTEHTLAVLDNATDAVMVCGMDVPSVRGTRKELAIFDELSLNRMTRHIVVNFADRRSGLTVKDVEAVLGIPIDVVLPRSRAVPLSTNQGVPLLQSRTRDPATRGLQQLVQRFQPQLRKVTASRGRHRAVAR